MQKLSIMIIALMTLVACTQERQAARVVHFNVSCVEQTKVSLNAGGRTVWNAGDKVSVFYSGLKDNLCADFLGQDGSYEGVISFESPSAPSEGRTYALSPYHSGNSFDGNTMTAFLPSQQENKEGSYAPGSSVLAGFENGGELKFRYVSALLSLRLSSSSSKDHVITSISLSSKAGEAIAGNLAIDISDENELAATVVSAGSATISMVSGGGALCTMKPGEVRTFYFSVAPVVLSKGYVFDVQFSNGEHKLYRNTDSLTLKSGVLYPISAGFSVEQKIVLDFNEMSFSPAFPSSAKITDNAGAAHSFVNAEDKETYSIVACSTIGGYYQTKVNGFKCLRFNQPANWLKLPMMEGMKLTRFGAMVRQNDSKAFAVSSTAGGSGDIVPNTNYPNASMVYSTVDSYTGDAIYIVTTSNNTQLSRIELIFE